MPFERKLVEQGFLPDPTLPIIGPDLCRRELPGHLVL